METRSQKLIREILNEKSPETDHSLGSAAFERAMSGERPRTLTAHEWEQWYAESGEKPQHLKRDN